MPHCLLSLRVTVACMEWNRMECVSEHLAFALLFTSRPVVIVLRVSVSTTALTADSDVSESVAFEGTCCHGDAAMRAEL